MLMPIFQERDVIRKGASYLRRYNTGSLDTTGMTPVLTLLRKKDGKEIPNAFQVARLTTSPTQPYDEKYDFAIVIARSVTSLLDPNTDYIINIDFDTNVSDTIPHGLIDIKILPGVERL